MGLVMEPAPREVIELIQARADKSLELHHRAAALLLPMQRLQKARQFVAADSLVLGLEFHGAVALLSRWAHHAAANALMRPMIESTIRAIWVLYVAPIERVNIIVKDRDKTTLEGMLAKLSKKQNHPVIVSLASQLTNTKSVLNSFTHAGFEQLKRRESGFELAEIFAQLMTADLFALMCLDLAGLLYGKAELKGIIIPELLVAVQELQEFSGKEGSLQNNGLPSIPEWPDLMGE